MNPRRRCACESLATRYELQTVVGISFNERYACAECGSRFDVATSFASFVLGGLGLALLFGGWLAPASRFGHGERPLVLAGLSAVAAGCIGLAIHSARIRRRRPAV